LFDSPGIELSRSLGRFLDNFDFFLSRDETGHLLIRAIGLLQRERGIVFGSDNGIAINRQGLNALRGH